LKLFGKKKKKGDQEANEEDSELQNVEDILSSDDIDFSDIESVINSSLNKGSDKKPKEDTEEKVLEVRSEVKGLEDKIENIENSVSSVRTDLQSLREDINSTDDSIKKLLSIYELVSKDINPFIDMNGYQKTELEMQENGNSIEGLTNDLSDLNLITETGDEFDLSQGLPEKLHQDNDIEIDTEQEVEPERNNGAMENGVDNQSNSTDTHSTPTSLNQNSTPHLVTQQDVGTGPNMPTSGPGVDMGQYYPSQYISEDGQAVDMNNSQLTPEKKLEQLKELTKFNTGREFLALNKNNNNGSILDKISQDYKTTLLVLRWIEFLFERVPRTKISLVLDYYQKLGWISSEVRSQLLNYARGEVADVLKYEPPMNDTEEGLLTGSGNMISEDYKPVDSWRLSAEDHLKSLLFIFKIKGDDINKDELNILDSEITDLKKSLENFYGI